MGADSPPAAAESLAFDLKMDRFFGRSIEEEEEEDEEELGGKDREEVNFDAADVGGGSSDEPLLLKIIEDLLSFKKFSSSSYFSVPFACD